MFPICSLSLPWVGFGTWCWETPAGCAGSRGVGDSGVYGMVIKVLLQAFGHALQSAACCYFSKADAFHLHSYCAKKCLQLQEIAGNGLLGLLPLPLPLWGLVSIVGIGG